MAFRFYRWLLAAVLFCSATSFAPAGVEAIHPFYISVTEIEHNSAEKTLEISCKVFAEDLEQILEKNNHVQLDIYADKDKANFDRLIPAYVNRHLSISVDGKPVQLSYIGFEVEKESAYCYLQVNNVPSIKKLDAGISILHDFTESQINIVHSTVNGKRQSTKLDFPAKVASFSF